MLIPSRDEGNERHFSLILWRIGPFIILCGTAKRALESIFRSLVERIADSEGRSTPLLFLMTPPVRGAVISFVIMPAYIPIILKRIRNEKQVLEEELAGYAKYKKRVRYKAIPFVW